MRNIISRTTMKKRLRKKTNPDLVETIGEALKHEGWNEVARWISIPTRNFVSKNLSEIDKDTKVGDTVVIPGKVLSKGNLTKKIRVCALAYSKKAKEKMKESKSEMVFVIDEIKKNPKAEGIRILR